MSRRSDGTQTEKRHKYKVLRSIEILSRPVTHIVTLHQLAVQVVSKNKIEYAKNGLGERSNTQSAGGIHSGGGEGAENRYVRYERKANGLNCFFNTLKETPRRMTLNFVKCRAKNRSKLVNTVYKMDTKFKKLFRVRTALLVLRQCL